MATAHPEPVLAADDNPDDIRLLQFAWRRAAASVPLHSVVGGEEAIAYLKGDGIYANRAEFPLPRLLLLDLKMPRKDGFEVLQFVRAHNAIKTLPVIVFTASLHREDVHRAFELGANAFLVKPVELQKLVELVTCLDSFWLKYNQSPFDP